MYIQYIKNQEKTLEAIFFDACSKGNTYVFVLYITVNTHLVNCKGKTLMIFTTDVHCIYSYQYTYHVVRSYCTAGSIIFTCYFNNMSPPFVILNLNTMVQYDPD